MINNEDWFKVIKARSYLYVIRERLDKIDTRFFTKFTNIYLIIGENSALLIDTGSGLANLKQVVDQLKGDKDLTVINTHNHFDHVGSNYQFEETQIHRWDFRKLMFPMDVSYLKGGTPEFVSYYESNNWKIEFAPECIPLIGDEIYELGGINVEVMYTPGHTPGSICLFTSHGEVFTGDTVNYGAVFLPGLDKMPFYKQSLEGLHQKIESINNARIFPSHEKFDVSKSLMAEFLMEFRNIDTSNGFYDPFLEATVHDFGNFIFVKPTEKSGGYELNSEVQ